MFLTEIGQLVDQKASYNQDADPDDARRAARMLNVARVFRWWALSIAVCQRWNTDKREYH